MLLGAGWGGRASPSPLSLIARTPTHAPHTPHTTAGERFPRRDEPFIGDSGFACRVDSDERPHGYVGTPGYMSPELHLQEVGPGLRGRTGSTIHSDPYT